MIRLIVAITAACSRDTFSILDLTIFGKDKWTKLSKATAARCWTMLLLAYGSSLAPWLCQQVSTSIGQKESSCLTKRLPRYAKLVAKYRRANNQQSALLEVACRCKQVCQLTGLSPVNEGEFAWKHDPQFFLNLTEKRHSLFTLSSLVGILPPSTGASRSSHLLPWMSVPGMSTKGSCQFLSCP